MGEFDWWFMTNQDMEVWNAVFDHLRSLKWRKMGTLLPVESSTFAQKGPVVLRERLKIDIIGP